MQAAELFAKGQSRAQVADELNVSWKAAHGWYQKWTNGGAEALKAKAKPGPCSKFSAGDIEVLLAVLTKGAVAYGYSNELWTLRRIGRVIEEQLDKRASVSEVWRLLKRMNWSPQKPHRQARERDDEKIQKWKTQTWPELVQKAKQEKRTIVFVDECGFSQKSTAKKTWAPEGETPTIEMNFNWDKLSVIGGISLKSVYFQVHEESIKSEQVIEFLKHLQRYLKGNILVIWDGLPAHRSKAVANYLKETKGRVWVESLPAYAPELNPIEYLWGNVKGGELANFSPKDLWELSLEAKKALTKRRGRPKALRAFWIQTELELNTINK